MNKKTIIEKVKDLFSEVEKPVEEVESKFVDVKTEDNRILRVDDIAVDSKVMEITEDGEIEVEDGTYKLEDGTSIVVAGGMITEVIEAEAEEESEVVEEVMEEAPEVVENFDNELASTVLDALKNVSERLNSIEAKFASQEAENKELKDQVEKFAKAPSVEHTETKLSFKQENKRVTPLHVALGKK